MKSKFVASSLFTVVYPISFALLALGMAMKGFTGMALVLFVLALVFTILFANNFRIYVITNNEFYTVNLLGAKYNCYRFDDMLKIYTLKGFVSYYRLGNEADYKPEILKIQMLSGEICKVDIDEVFTPIEFVNELREKLDEHKYEIITYHSPDIL